MTVCMFTCKHQIDTNLVCGYSFPSLANYGVCAACAQTFCKTHMIYPGCTKEYVSRGLCLRCIQTLPMNHVELYQKNDKNIHGPKPIDEKVPVNFFLNCPVTNIDYFIVNNCTYYVLTPNKI